VVEDWETLRARIQRQVVPEDQVWETLRTQIIGEAEPEQRDLDPETAHPPMTPLEPNPQIRDREILLDHDEQTLKTPVASVGEPEVEVREIPISSPIKQEVLRLRIGLKADAEGDDQETPRPHATTEPLRKQVSIDGKHPTRLDRTFGNFLSLVFGIIGMLVALQAYNWLRIRQLETLGKQLEDRPSAVQEALQKDIEKRRTALDQINQKMAALGQAYQQMVAKGETHDKVIPRSQETVHQSKKAATHEQPNQAEAREKPGAGQQRISGAATGPPPSLQSSLVTVQGRVSQDPLATRQEPSITQEDVHATRQEPSVTRGDVHATPQEPAATREDGRATRQEPSVTQEDVNAARRESLATQKEPPDKTAGYVAKLIVPDPPLAHNHNEIQNLRTVGDRDYFEFTLVRSSARQEVVPGISLQLKKVDVRKLRCTLNIFADDYELPDSQSVNERISFPIRAGWQSVELVINQVKRDRVVGYLSALKGVLVTGK
jgi:hypothetical protein